MKYNFFDTHSDSAAVMFLENRTLTDETMHMNLPAVRRLGHLAQCFAFCTTCYDTPLSAQEQFAQGMANFKKMLSAHADEAALCGSTRQIQETWAAGKPLAAVLALEGAEAIGCDPGRLEQAKADGVRVIGLTWNYENALSGTHFTGGGLTAQGREFVRRAQQLGILIDLSHSSDQTFYDVCDIAEKPFIASHSNSRAVCGVSRNLTDDMFRKLAELGGSAGTNLCGDFLNPEGHASAEDILRHLEHFLELGGENSLHLGGDWDGIPYLPAGMTGVDGWLEITDYLENHGLSETFLRKYTSETMLRLLSSVGAGDMV